MSSKRFAPLVWCLAGACVALLGLLFGLNRQVQGQATPALGTDFGAYITLPARSLQASQTVSMYLPTVLRNAPMLPPIYGVQINSLGNALLRQRAVEGGAYWVRYPTFDWDLIEPVRTDPPTYNWNAVNKAALQRAHEQHLTVIAIVRFAPSWAQEYPGSACGPIRADRYDEYAQFLAALVREFSGPPYFVKYYELGNEPDADLFYTRSVYGCWGIPGDPYYGGRTYGQMLKAVYPTFKAANPGAQLLIGGLLLHSPNTEASRFFEGILVAGAGNSFDIVSFHAYPQYDPSKTDFEDRYGWPGGLVVGKVDQLQSDMAARGLDKPLIQTEAGLLCPASKGCLPNDAFLQAQADYVVQLFVRNIDLGLLGTTWYTLEGPGWEDGGMLDANQNPRPAYVAFQFMTTTIGDAEYMGPVYSYPKMQAYAFRKRNGNLLHVLWSADGAIHTATWPVSRWVQGWDKLGNALPVHSDPVLVQVLSPIYVELQP